MASLRCTARFLPPEHLVKTHPEKVIERLYSVLSDANEFDTVTRRRLGDAIYVGYGALWDATYACSPATVDPTIS